MCGRYELKLGDDRKGRQIRERCEKLDLLFSEGEIFPSSNVLCVVPAGSKIDLRTMRWGIGGKRLQINARIESLKDHISYESMKHKRCAVICNGFYEWDDRRRKYYISFAQKYMYLACIFNESDELLIMTREADEGFKRIHGRMPIILDQPQMLAYIHDDPMTIDEKQLFIKELDDQTTLF